MEPFWMIWNPDGNAPTYQHMTKDSAKGEAERLALSCGYDKFYVLKAVACCQRMKPVSWDEAEDNDDIPF